MHLSSTKSQQSSLTFVIPDMKSPRSFSKIQIDARSLLRVVNNLISYFSDNLRRNSFAPSFTGGMKLSQ